MKKISLFSALFALYLMASAQTVTLTFTGRDAGNSYVQLSRVVVTNLTKGWQETLTWPDTVLTMQNGTGIEDYFTNGGLSLSQNNPNPFNGTTDVLLSVADAGALTVEIADIYGRLVETQNIASLLIGNHQFRIALSSAGTYVMTVRQNGKTASIKMVNNGGGNGNKIEYAGMVGANLQAKSGARGATNDPFTFGDQMEYVGYAIFNGSEAESQRILQMQGASQTFVLQFDVAQTQDGQPCPGAPTVTDYDGNTYNTVQIGQQCWMRENIRTKHFADGTAIPAGGSNTSNTNPYYYDHSSSIALTSRGYLYNWPAAMHSAASSSANPSGVQGICPAGWHLPSDDEWTTLTNYVSSQSEYQCGGDSSYIAKALASTTGWGSSLNTCAVGKDPSANNATGLSAVPGGECSGSSFYYALSRAIFWSSTQRESNFAWYRELDYNTAIVSYNYCVKKYGFSVRCLRDNNGGETTSLPTVTTNTVSNITATSATCGGNVTAAGGATVTARGVCWSTSQNPTVSESHTTNGSGMGSFTSSITGLTDGTTYYVRAYATNSGGTAYGNQVSFSTSSYPFTCGTSTVTDFDGNTYNTVQIGQQCWMKQNLRTTHYADGTSIPAGGSSTSNYSPYYYDYSSSIALTSRGYLYNWPAAMHSAASSSANPSGVQGICPTGWHLPSNAEWTQLTNYVSSQSQYLCGSNYYSHIAKALASTTGWSYSSNTCAVGNNQTTNNATGFSAVPAGIRDGSLFDYAGYSAVFWSSTQSSSSAWYRSLNYNGADVNSVVYNKSTGYSVRCLRD